MIEEIVEGWTFPLDFMLLKNGAPFTEAELAGASFSLILKDKDGVAVVTTDKVSSPSTSVVRFTPEAGDLVADKSPYTAHWVIETPVSGNIYVPRGEPDRWLVRKQ